METVYTKDRTLPRADAAWRVPYPDTLAARLRCMPLLGGVTKITYYIGT